MAGDVKSFQVEGEKYSVKPDLTFDSTPTRGSSNPVTSNGIAVAIESVSIGTDISVGRTEGTPVGEYSIAFGTNNTAAGQYSIVFGANNVVMSVKSIVSGDYNKLYYMSSNIIAGSNNQLSAIYGLATGDYNKQGTSIVRSEPSFTPRNVYIGYVNISTKKIYRDPEMTNEIAVSLSSSNPATYFFDLTNTAGRTPGDVYKYEYKRVNYSWTYVLSGKLDFDHVVVTDYLQNSTFLYRGPCYFDQGADVNYTDSSKTTVIDPLPNYGRDAGADYYVYLDIAAGYILAPNNHPKIYNRFPKWSHVKVYYGRRTNIYDVTGRCAYVLLDNAPTASVRGHAYSGEDCSAETDITDQLYDGEFVSDYFRQGALYQYLKDINGNLRNIRNNSGNSWIDPYCNGIGTANSCITSGDGNNIIGGLGGVAIGAQNRINNGACGAPVMIGFSNHMNIMPGRDTNYNSNNYNVLIGLSNGIDIFDSSRLSSILSVSTVLGRDNQIYVYGTSGAYSVNGYNNYINGYGNVYLNINGSYNTNRGISYTSVNGQSNTVKYISYSHVYGEFNSIGGWSNYDVESIRKNEEGIWTGDGVSYNTTSHLYTFPTNTIFEKYGVISGYDPQYDYFLGYAISSDGHTLTDITNLGSSYVHAFGYYNDFKQTELYRGTDDGTVYMFGVRNTIIAGSDTKEVSAIGSHVKIEGSVSQGAVFIGSWNTMTGTTGAQFVVGVGTSDNARANGFVAYNTGAVAAPSSPDTISGGVNAMANTGTSSDKMLITYAQLRDYTGPGGGGSSRPLVTTITLASADWSALEQTVSVSGMTADSIVIVQPSGSSYAFNHDDVYLASQGSGTLTFGCAVAPTVDIDVKVVYWV